MFTIPPTTERFALLSFDNPSLSEEAIEWLDEKPVTLPSRYAESRDCEVWKGWQGSLVVATNEVGRLVPSRVIDLFPSLPMWAKQRVDERDPTAQEEGEDDSALDDGSYDDYGPDSRLNKRKSSFTSSDGGSRSAKFPFQPSLAETGRELTPSEKFLLTHEQFPKGPGNRLHRGPSPGKVAGDKPAPYPQPGKSGRPPLPPQTSLFALPPPKPAAVPSSQPNASSYSRPDEIVRPTVPSNPLLTEPIPTSIGEMARLIVDLKGESNLLDAQHSRMTIVARDPADWSLAIAHLTKSMMSEQEALEDVRRNRAKGEDTVKSWEGVLQRNDVGIEERRGFVLDVLDMLDSGVLGQKQVSTCVIREFGQLPEPKVHL